jgi:DNA repair protein RadC
MNYVSIKNWAVNDRPREKLLQNGALSLSDAELLAVLIGTGTRELSAVELSRRLLQESKNNLAELSRKSLGDLMKLKGIGEAKAITIQAALELGRRRKMSELGRRTKLVSSKDVFDYIGPVLSDLNHEEFWVLYMNRSNIVIDKYKVSQGGLSGTVIDVRLILKRGIELLATSLIICHNHPSGNLAPSDNDRNITARIKAAGEQLDIRVLDHIIVADNSYFSFSDESIL